MLLSDLKAAKFIAITRRVPLAKMPYCAEAVVNGGGKFLEITFDPSDADTLKDTADKIRIVREKFPQLHVGCGTTLTVDMVKAAADAGAEYAVSPNTSQAVINAAKARNLCVMPGALTPTEIANAYDMGADLVKIFPVQPGEESYVKNIMSPLSHIPFIVTGGINPGTIRSMLATGAVAVAAGITVFKPELLEKCDWAGITALFKAHLEAI